MKLAGKTAGAAAALGLAIAAAAMPVAAQEADFSDARLDSFVQAVIDIAELRQKYEVQMAEAGGEAEQQKLAEAFQSEAIAVVEAAPDLTVDQYVEIGQQATEDAELGARIREMLAARMDG
ncbi:DUF4168 domain-containing protein [Rhodovulum sp. YNF3179]|uniref:DUF4168 domain-containing protein n=1 Tax=Rhodovulum sp. YNF3179 TaxID=3425127 RepID=UPI003D32FEC1